MLCISLLALTSDNKLNKELIYNNDSGRLSVFHSKWPNKKPSTRGKKDSVMKTNISWIRNRSQIKFTTDSYVYINFSLCTVHFFSSQFSSSAAATKKSKQRAATDFHFHIYLLNRFTNRSIDIQNINSYVVLFISDDAPLVAFVLGKTFNPINKKLTAQFSCWIS